MTYHMKNWEYFIELSCYQAGLMKKNFLIAATDMIEETLKAVI